jgi:hypothetical protein
MRTAERISSGRGNAIFSYSLNEPSSLSTWGAMHFSCQSSAIALSHGEDPKNDFLRKVGMFEKAAEQHLQVLAILLIASAVNLKISAVVFAKNAPADQICDLCRLTQSSFGRLLGRMRKVKARLMRHVWTSAVVTGMIAATA